MKCFRITFYQRGHTYHICRESSFHMERLADAERIQSIMSAEPVRTWEDWLRLVDTVRKMPSTYWKGYVYIFGVELQRTVIHG